MAMDHRIDADGVELAAHLAPAAGPAPGLVLSHGFPTGLGGGPKSAHTYPQLADRIARHLGWTVVAINFRGCRPSAGQFSLQGWLADLSAAAEHLRGADGVSGVWLAGFGTGGALSVCAAAADPHVRGVAAMGAPSDFDDWVADARALFSRARAVGVMGDWDRPTPPANWQDDLKSVRAVTCAEVIAPRPLLVMHGSADELVPELGARALADAHGDAELRLISGAGHQLRHDPRAVAVFLGWLDRQRGLTTDDVA